MSTHDPNIQHRGVLPVVLLSLALVVAAVPALNVALPDVAASTDASMSQLQWVVDAYALVFAGLLLPAGALGDRYGRKPVLVAGLAVFAAGAGARGADLHPDGADRPARADGRGRRAGHAHHPVDHHQLLPGRAARQGGRRLDRRRRRGRRLRPAHLRAAARGLGLAVRVLVQRGPGPRRRRARRTPDPELARREHAPRRLRRRPAVRAHARRRRLRRHRGTRAGLDRRADPGRLRRRRRRPARLGGLGPGRDEPAPRPAPVRPPGLQHRRAVDRPAVLRVLRVHLPGRPVRPAGARLLGAAGRSGADPDGDGARRPVPQGPAPGHQGQPPPAGRRRVWP